jgi:hypothetical protein
MTNSLYFKIISSSMIVGNSLVLGLSYHGMNKSQELNLEYLNLFFFSFFSLELLLKIIG